MHFQIWDDGDESVGIHGNFAELDIDVGFLDGEDCQEYIESIKETLSAAFSSIWDNGRVRVATEEELMALDVVSTDKPAMPEVTANNDQMFLERMARYTRSMNGVPVDRVSIHSADLLRLINMVNSQQVLFIAGGKE